MKKNISRWIIAALAIAVVVLFTRVSTLTNQLSHLQNNYEVAFSRLENDIQNIYANVDEQLKAEASLLTHVEFSLGELNTDTHQLELHLTVTPKALTEDMELSVQVDGKTAPLTRSGASFSGIIPVELFADSSSYPLLSIASDGVTRTQELTEVYIGYLGYNYLPTLMASYSGKTTHTDLGGLALNGELSVDSSIQTKDGSVAFGELTLLAELNGKEIYRQSLGSPLTEEEGHFIMPLQNSFTAFKGDSLVLYVLGEDSLGYIHEVPFYSWEESEEGYPTTAIETNERIYDKNGVLLSES